MSSDCQDCATKKHNSALCRRAAILVEHKSGSSGTVSVTVEDKTYRLDRKRLGAFSPYFLAMFDSSFHEGSEGHVDLFQAKRRPFEVLLDFVAGGDPLRYRKDSSLLLDSVELADRLCLDLFLAYYREELLTDGDLKGWDLALAFALAQRLHDEELVRNVGLRVRRVLQAMHYRKPGKVPEAARVLEEASPELVGWAVAVQDGVVLCPPTADQPCECADGLKLMDGLVHWTVHKAVHRLRFMPDLAAALKLRTVSKKLLDSHTERIMEMIPSPLVRRDVQNVLLAASQ